VFWPLNSSSQFSGVSEDSNFPLLGVWVSSSHLSQSGVVTLALWFLTFLLIITYVLSTSTFQKISNGIKNSLIQWLLTGEIFFKKFEIPWGLQFPKWESTWECMGSFPHTPRSANVTLGLHSQFTHFHAFALVVSPKLGSWHIQGVKGKITTLNVECLVISFFPSQKTKNSRTSKKNIKLNFLSFKEL